MILLPKIYAGPLDDVLWRSPWAGPEGALINGENYQAEDVLNELLLTTALTDSILTVNDGYLISLPAARKQLVDEYSPLRFLIKHKRILVLSRNAHLEGRGLHTLPEEMANEGVRSYQDMVESKLFKQTVFPELVEVDGILKQAISAGAGYEQWPDFDQGHSFRLLMEKAIQEDPSSLGLSWISSKGASFHKEVYNAYEPLVRLDTRAARTKWETAVKDVLKRAERDGKLTRHEAHAVGVQLMELACQCYQVGFAAGMRKSDDSIRAIRVMCRSSRAFDELFQVPAQDWSESEDGIEEISESIPIPVYAKSTISKMFEDTTFFERLFAEADALSKSRQRYARALNQLFSGKSSAIPDVWEAASAFTKEAAEHLVKSAPSHLVFGGVLLSLLKVGANGKFGAGLGVFSEKRIAYFIKRFQLKMQEESVVKLNSLKDIPLSNVRLSKQACDALDLRRFEPSQP